MYNSLLLALPSREYKYIKTLQLYFSLRICRQQRTGEQIDSSLFQVQLLLVRSTPTAQ